MNVEVNTDEVRFVGLKQQKILKVEPTGKRPTSFDFNSNRSGPISIFGRSQRNNNTELGSPNN